MYKPRMNNSMFTLNVPDLEFDEEYPEQILEEPVEFLENQPIDETEEYINDLIKHEPILKEEGI